MKKQVSNESCRPAATCVADLQEVVPPRIVHPGAKTEIWNDFRQLLRAHLLVRKYPMAAKIMSQAETHLFYTGGVDSRHGELEYWIYKAHIGLFVKTDELPTKQPRTRLIPQSVQAAPGWPDSLIDVLSIYRTREKLPSILGLWILLLELLMFEKREDYLTVVDRVTKLPSDGNADPAIKSAILLTAGRCANHLGRPSRTEVFMRRAVEEAQAAGYPAIRGEALFELGSHFAAREMPLEALPFLFSALELFLRLGDFHTAAEVRLLTARLQARCGNVSEAALGLSEVVRAAQMLPAAELEIKAQLQYAEIDLAAGRIGDARQRLLANLPRVRREGDSETLISLHLLLVRCYCSAGRFRQAHIARRAAWRALLYATVNRQLPVIYHATTAELYLGQLEFTQAQRSLRRAERINEPLLHPHQAKHIRLVKRRLHDAMAGSGLNSTTSAIQAPPQVARGPGAPPLLPNRSRVNKSSKSNSTPACWRRFGIVTASSRVHAELIQVSHIAPTLLPVLIHGETGSGKELIARAVHAMSGKEGPFVVFNSATCRNDLFEAEMFGHRKGAFTGAIRNREGLVAQAENGALFLDEIADLSPAAQASLLRFLDTGEVRAVGSDQTVKIKTRIISASHHGLRALVAAGKFRRDLFFRLAGIEVRLPPLRERPEDIRPLLEHFADRAGIDPHVLSEIIVGAMAERLLTYSWPGNIRQLSHWVTQLGALLSGELPLPQVKRLLNRALSVVFSAEGHRSTRRKAAYVPEREELKRLVARFDGNISRIAAEIGTYRTQVYRLLREMDIDHHQYRKKNPPE
jgi:DNA-binding NtrC family response regulator